MRRLLLLSALIAATVVAALPATATGKPDLGTRIGLFQAPTTFVANTPFYIEHGFACVLGDSACMTSEISAHSSFDLYVNEVLQASRPDVAIADDEEVGRTITKLYVTDFPSGLPAGTYTFHGEWWKDGVLMMERDASITFS